ncbi:MAG: InlB B-repeat-containing protein, partial [Clostridiales bacterium]|nr:InlB B-repeat-containing protein [Clostridiales bacterium]
MKKTRKLILIITAVVALIASMLIIASCGDTDDTDKPPKTYTLTFVTDGGTEIDPIKAEAGKTITPPADPQKDGYEFVGWYLDATDMDGDPVAIPTVMPDHDVTYYAKYVEEWDGLRIKYEYNLGNVAHSGTVADTLGYTGDTKKAADGTAFGVNGYRFIGWTTDKNTALVFSGETPSGQYFAGDDIVFGNTDITL